MDHNPGSTCNSKPELSPNDTYIGRFAPSPSGPLHFGSLVCAVASYLDAKSNAGAWLVRIEDIDPPREMKNATTLILQSLESHGLFWDQEVRYQSQRSEAYRDALKQINQLGLSYHCTCTRKRLRTLSVSYDGHCRNANHDTSTPTTLRLNLDKTNQYLQYGNLIFEDGIQGKQISHTRALSDFMIHRKDGLFAYHLAVVVDDIDQGITHIVRGSDLLDCTIPQLLLTGILRRDKSINMQHYAHIPVVLKQDGSKLSKQTFAKPIDNKTANTNIYNACRLLGVELEASLEHEPVRTILEAAGKKWDINLVPKSQTFNETFS